MIICGVDSGIKNFAISVLDYDENDKLKSNLSNLPKILFINKYDLLDGIEKENKTIYTIESIIEILNDINNKFKIELLILEQQIKISTNNYEIMSVCATWAIINNINIKIKSPKKKYEIIGLESTFKSYRNLKEQSKDFIKDKYKDNKYFTENIKSFNKQDDITDSIFIVLQYILGENKDLDIKNIETILDN